MALLSFITKFLGLGEISIGRAGNGSNDPGISANWPLFTSAVKIATAIKTFPLQTTSLSRFHAEPTQLQTPAPTTTATVHQTTRALLHATVLSVHKPTRRTVLQAAEKTGLRRDGIRDARASIFSYDHRIELQASGTTATAPKHP